MLKSIFEEHPNPHVVHEIGKKIALLRSFAKECEEIVSTGYVHPMNPAVCSLAAKARMASKDLEACLRITAKETESDTAIVNKLLGKFAIGVDRLNRVRIGGKQMWVYKIRLSTKVDTGLQIANQKPQKQKLNFKPYWLTSKTTA